MNAQNGFGQSWMSCSRYLRMPPRQHSMRATCRRQQAVSLDFRSIVSNAVAGLANNTPDARSDVYAQARGVVHRHLELMRLPEPIVELEKLALDLTIRKVERQACAAQSVPEEEEEFAEEATAPTVGDAARFLGRREFRPCDPYLAAALHIRCLSHYQHFIRVSVSSLRLKPSPDLFPSIQPQRTNLSFFGFYGSECHAAKMLEIYKLDRLPP
jgi:hypothetical protein